MTTTPEPICDCHFHVFGPFARYPLASDRAYTPPEASVASYRDVMSALGIGRSVIVQPSVYGRDNARTVDAARALGGPTRCRIVAVIDAETSDAALDRLAEAGTVGVRINAVAGGGPLAAAIGRIAARAAERGWHVQLFLPPGTLAPFADALAALPAPLVLDHLGGLDPAEGPDAPTVRALHRLLDGGRTWVKLSAPYLCSRSGAPWSELAPVVRALAGSRTDRLVWGSNWPHPVGAPPATDDRELLVALARVLDDEAAVRAVFRDNAARLYGFDR